MFKKTLWWIFKLSLGLAAFLAIMSYARIPEQFTYGVSFSKLHADELNLDWKKVFLASLDDLRIRNFRLSAHWPMIEPQKDQYNFSELDFQMNAAKDRKANVILAVGRRLPGWPECHDPQWALGLSKEQKQQELLDYITAVVTRYKDYPNLTYWQVENEAFLTMYAKHSCQDFFDTTFFEKEIALVRSLDSDTPIFLTDSGELSLWYQAYSRADAFGTSIYLYVWNHTFGPMKYPISPAFFRIKHNLVRLFAHGKPAIISELSTEPWLLKPIIETPVEGQLERMDIDKFNTMLEFARKTGFDTIYLWGVEWWYYMKEKGHPEFWNAAKQLYR